MAAGSALIKPPGWHRHAQQRAKEVWGVGPGEGAYRGPARASTEPYNPPAPDWAVGKSGRVIELTPEEVAAVEDPAYIANLRAAELAKLGFTAEQVTSLPQVRR